MDKMQRTKDDNHWLNLMTKRKWLEMCEVRFIGKSKQTTTRIQSKGQMKIAIGLTW
jgi:hypothetical protein